MPRPAQKVVRGLARSEEKTAVTAESAREVGPSQDRILVFSSVPGGGIDAKGALQKSFLSSQLMNQSFAVPLIFLSNSSYIVPPGPLQWVLLQMWGAGGGGGGGSSGATGGAGGGGGSGSFISEMIALAPGAYPIVAGIGGSAGVGASPTGVAGGDGSESSFFGRVAGGGGGGGGGTVAGLGLPKVTAGGQGGTAGIDSKGAGGPGEAGVAGSDDGLTNGTGGTVNGSSPIDGPSRRGAGGDGGFGAASSGTKNGLVGRNGMVVLWTPA
jgi:hypothetical protein